MNSGSPGNDSKRRRPASLRVMRPEQGATGGSLLALWHFIKRAEHSAPTTGEATRFVQPMRAPKPHLGKPRREIRARELGFFEPWKLVPDQARVLDGRINRCLEPRRMPGAKHARGGAAAKESRVALHRKFGE